MATDLPRRAMTTSAVALLAPPAPYRQELLPGRCRHCGRLVVFVRLVKETNHALHALLSLLTGGIWIPVWIWSCCRAGASKPWECAECGRSFPSAERP